MSRQADRQVGLAAQVSWNEETGGMEGEREGEAVRDVLKSLALLLSWLVPARWQCYVIRYPLVVFYFHVVF